MFCFVFLRKRRVAFIRNDFGNDKCYVQKKGILVLFTHRVMMFKIHS